MDIDTSALATSTTAVIALVGTLSVKVFLLLATTIGLSIGLWFLGKAIRKTKGSVK